MSHSYYGFSFLILVIDKFSDFFNKINLERYLL